MSMNILPNYSAGRKSSGGPILPDCSQTAGIERAQQSLESQENRDETEEGVVEIDVDLDPEEENEDEDEENDAYFDPWDAGVDPNARGAVEQWRIVAVGHRPKDYLARDCLYGSLWRDHRVPWFRRYLKKPAPWMEALVDHLGDKSDRRQALHCVVLDYLHKLHLARLYPILQYQYGEGDELTRFQRLWRCTPYTVQVERRNGGKKNVRGCGR